MPTPLEFEDRYHNLDVIIDDYETTTVDVHRYRNNSSKYDTDAYKEKNTVEAMKQEERLVSMMNTEDVKLRKIQLKKPKLEWKPRNQDVSLQLDTSFLASPRIFTDVLTGASPLFGIGPDWQSFHSLDAGVGPCGCAGRMRARTWT